MVSTALAKKLEPQPATAEPSESFESFFVRNVARWPWYVGLAMLFLAIRGLGGRAGALLLIAASVGFLPLSLVRPEFGLYGLVLNFVNEWDTYYKLQSYVPISLPLLFDVAIAVGIARTTARHATRVGLEYPQILLLAVYVALVTLSVIVSPIGPRPGPRSVSVWQNFRTGFLIRPTIFLFVIFIVRDSKSLYRILFALVIGHGFLMATGLSDIIQKAGPTLYRVRGTVSAINYLSYVCIVTISIVIMLFLYLRDSFSRAALAGLTFVTMLVSLRTLSRSGYYAFPFPLIYLGSRLARSPRILLVAVSVGALFYLLTPSGLEERLAQVESLTTTDRYYLSRIALRIAVDYPLLGVGWQSYEAAFPAYDVEHVFRKPKAPHSLFLAIAARSGFPALLVYMAMFGITFIELLAVERLYRTVGATSAFGYYLAIGLQAALVGHFVFGLAGSYGDSYYGFFVLALSFVLIRHHRQPGAELLR